MGPDIGPHAVPQQFYGAFVAVGLEDAGAPEFQKAQRAVALEKRRDVKFARRVKTADEIGHLLAQQTIGCHHFGFWGAEGFVLERCMVDHQNVIAEGVIDISIAPQHGSRWCRHCRHFLVKHLVAQPLRALDVLRLGREADFQRAEAAERRRHWPLALAQLGKTRKQPRNPGKRGVRHAAAGFGRRRQRAHQHGRLASWPQL